MPPALGLILALVCALLAIALAYSLYSLNILRRSQRRFAVMGRVAHDVLWEWNLRTNLVWHCGDLSRFYAIGEAERVQPIEWWLKKLPPDDADRVWQSLQRAIHGDATEWNEEYRLLRGERQYVTVTDRGFIVRDRRGKATHVIGGAADITASKEAERRMAEHAFYDTLTGLPKRELFLSRLEGAMGRLHPATTEQLAVPFLDLDRFKVVNDSLWHAVGDRLLVLVAERIS